eukprot:scaffold313502_cov35-Tisochrysis_lutea.AAC.1
MGGRPAHLGQIKCRVSELVFGVRVGAVTPKQASGIYMPVEHCRLKRRAAPVVGDGQWRAGRK